MFEVLDEKCMPERKTKFSAYVDLKAKVDMTIEPGEQKIIPLGVKIDLEKLKQLFGNSLGIYDNYVDGMFEKFCLEHYLEVAIRSSLSAKYGLIIANGSGKIDLDYPDEIGIIIFNPLKIVDKHTPAASFKINKGDSVAQTTIMEHKGCLMGYKSEKIRTGGFGSTGK